MRNARLILLLLFCALPVWADWPIEPYQGNLFFSLEDERRDFPVAAFCDSVGGVSVVIASEATNLLSQLFIQGVDIHGNLRWPDNPNGHLVTPDFTSNESYHAVPGPDGTSFVGWRNYYSNYPFGDDLCMELRLQRVGADGQAQWNDGYGNVLAEYHYPYNGDSKELISINPLPDGSVYAFWYDNDVLDFDYEQIYDGNYHIQRFAPDGTEMWEPGGLEPFPDSLVSQWGPGASRGAVVMDSGHVAFIIENSIIRIRPDGSYVWARNEMVLDSLSTGTKTKFIYRDTNDTLVVVGAKGTDEYVCYKITSEGEICLYQEFDYNTFNTIDQAQLEKYPSHDYSLVINSTLIMLDGQLEPIFPDIGHDLTSIGYFHQFDVNDTGIGVSGDNGEARRLVFRFDTNGDELWTGNVYDDTSGTGRVIQALDDDGNMFVFWLKDLGGERSLDCYANVLSPDGTWGQPLAVTEDGRWSPALPSQLEVTAYPNPFNSTLNLSIRSSTPGPPTIQVYDLLGRLVHRMSKSNKVTASGRYVWQAESLPSGMYFIQVQDGHGNRLSRRVVLLK